MADKSAGGTMFSWESEGPFRINRLASTFMVCAMLVNLGGPSAPAQGNQPAASKNRLEASTKTAPVAGSKSSKNAAPGDEQKDRVLSEPGAGEEDFYLLDLEELLNTPIVTASGEEESSALAAADVTTITSDEIERKGWHSLTEVLGSTLGFYVIDDHVIPSVSVRGVSGGLYAGSRLIKVQINGVAVNFRPSLTAFIGPEFIAMDAVERIEIVKGPLSAIYGANAFLAVVNIITKQPGTGAAVSARLYSGSHYGGSGASGVLEYAGEHVQAMAAYTLDHVDRSGVRIQKTFDQKSEVPVFQPIFDLRNVSEDDIARPQGAFIYMKFLLKTFGTITLQGGMQEIDSMGEFQLNSIYTHKSRYDLINLWTNLRYENSWWEDLLAVAGWIGWSQGYPGQDERFYLTGSYDSAFRRNFNYHAFDGGVQLRLRLLRDFALSAGVDFSLENQRILYYTEILNEPVGLHGTGYSRDLFISPDDPIDVKLSNVGIYVQGIGALVPGLKDLRLTLNFRYDIPGDFVPQSGESYKLFPNQISWRGGVAYRWSKNFTTKIIVGQAFQIPSAVLLFARQGFGMGNNVIGSRTLPGREDLVPQSMLSGSFAVNAFLFESLMIQASVYLQQMSDRIVFQKTGANFIAENIEEKQNGVGGELTVMLLKPIIQPYLKACYHRNLESEAGGRSLEGERILPPHPEFFALLGLNLDVPGYHLKLNGEMRYVSERGATQGNIYLNNNKPYTLAPYLIFDLAISTSGLKITRDSETKFVLALRNLTDKRYSEPSFGGFDIPNLGRTVLFEIKQSI